MKQKKTNRQKVEDILMVIDSIAEYKPENIEHETNHYVQKISGQIGDDITFNGKKYVRYLQENRFDPDFNPHSELELQSKAKKLSKISTQYKFGFGKKWRYPKINGYGNYCEETLAPLKNITEITVTSPAWNEENGVTTVTGKGRKKLRVFHGRNETADSLIAEVYDDVVGKQNKMAEVKNLRENYSKVRSVTFFDEQTM